MKVQSRVFFLFRQRSLEQLEEKMSALKKELVTVKESLNQTMLEKDLLESAKEGLSGALSKVSIMHWSNLLVKDSHT